MRNIVLIVMLIVIIVVTRINQLINPRDKLLISSNRKKEQMTDEIVTVILPTISNDSNG